MIDSLSCGIVRDLGQKADGPFQTLQEIFEEEPKTNLDSLPIRVSAKAGNLVNGCRKCGCYLMRTQN